MDLNGISTGSNFKHSNRRSWPQPQWMPTGYGGASAEHVRVFVMHWRFRSRETVAPFERDGDPSPSNLLVGSWMLSVSSVFMSSVFASFSAVSFSLSLWTGWEARRDFFSSYMMILACLAALRDCFFAESMR